MTTCVLYARISVTKEESVSVERQLEAGRQYAASRGWQVVAEFRDDGVSASHNKPEDRKGWRALLATATPYDVVVIWKVDRLARRTLDFLNADEALQQRKAAVVAVEDPIDMTTPQGRGFATMLAVFAEMEAAGISARVKAARRYLLRNGRVVGGTVPYGFQSVRNPDGPGYVLIKHPDESPNVREMVDRVLAGGTVYSLVQWLESEGIPSPTGKPRWSYTTVERVLRHPALAGMTPYNPGNQQRSRGSGVLLDQDGMPVVDESAAIVPVDVWRRMVHLLDTRTSAQSRPKAMRSETSALLSGLVWCADCDQRMWRGTIQGRPGYYCRKCHQVISNFEEIVVDEFLRVKGDDLRFTRIEEVYEGGSVPEIQHRITEVLLELGQTEDDEETAKLTAQLARLKELRRDARKATTTTVQEVSEGDTYAEAWALADSVEQRRRVLGAGLERIWVSRGGTGRRSPAKVLQRLRFDWLGLGEQELAPDEDPADLPDYRPAT